MPDSPNHGSRLAFPVTEELTREALSAIEKIRRDPGDKTHVASLVAIVLKLTDAGLHEYYQRPLERAGGGMIALGTAKVGIGTAKRGISVLVKKILGAMTEDQLLSVVDSMESMLIRSSADTESPANG